MSNRQRKPVWKVLVVFTSGALVFTMVSLLLPARANANPAIVINEIMYNPTSDNSNDEFIELHNTSGSSVDISNWCFTDGVVLCFGPGTDISGGGYIVVSPNASKTLSTYSVTTTATYTGNLSNGGEKLELSDDSSSVVDTVEYGDNTPWPNSTDGTGPSLELTDPSLDNNLSTSWSASFVSGGTPGADNTMLGLNLPTASNASTTTIVASGSTVTVTATVSNATTVNLVYKVMFDSEVTLTMNDDGASGDGASGDGVYGATIPAQTDGSLVRYRIDAINSDGTTSLPGINDSTNYYPYIVDDGETADIPIVRWYMDPADYTDMTTNHLNDDMLFSAVVAVGEQVFDNSRVRVKGQSSTNFPKRKYKFEIPKGYELGAPIFDHPIDEFSIQVYFLNLSDMQEGLGWRGFKEAGFDSLQNRYVRVHKNNDSSSSEFHGHYLLIENYDASWRERNGYETGSMYKQAQDKKTRLDEDNSDIVALVDALTTLEDDELKNYLLDNINIPAVINYHATAAATFSTDWTFVKNIYQYRDTEGTGRWEYLPWDLDNNFLPSIFVVPNSVDYLKEPITVLAHPSVDETSFYYQWAILERAMYQFPEFRDMFFRRTMSMYDTIWSSDAYLEWHDNLYNPSEQTMSDDYAKWNPFRQAILEGVFPDGFPYTFVDGFPFDIDEDEIFESSALQSPSIMRGIFLFSAQKLKNDVSASRANGELLLAETFAQKNQVGINEIHYNPDSGQSHEFIEIYNNSNTPIDISEWQIEGVNYTIPNGSVLPANSTGVVVANDTSFRDQNPSALILGEYPTSLSNSGQSLVLKDSTGKTISSVTYGVNSKWPTSPNGQGKTLSLVYPAADESNPACWAPSQNIGGTPYAQNTIDASWDTSDCFTIDQANVSSNAGTTYQASQTEQTDESSLIDDIVSGSLKQPATTNALIDSDDTNQLAIVLAGLGISILIGFTANAAYAKLKARKTDVNTDM